MKSSTKEGQGTKRERELSDQREPGKGSALHYTEML